MAAKTLHAILRSKKLFHPSLAEFSFELEENTHWQEGQFAMIHIEDNKAPSIKRAYSIASSSQKSPIINFVIKKVEEGRGTEWLFDTVKEGDKITLSLPFGHMTFKNSTKKEVLLIGTGIGIAPMLGILDSLQEQCFPQKTRLIFGVRYEEDLCYYKRLQEYAEKYDNFHFYPIVSRPSDKWEGMCGRSDAILKQLNIHYEKQNIYICGSPQVAQSLKDLLIKLGTPLEEIQMEAF